MGSVASTSVLYMASKMSFKIAPEYCEYRVGRLRGGVSPIVTHGVERNVSAETVERY